MVVAHGCNGQRVTQMLVVTVRPLALTQLLEDSLGISYLRP